MVFMFNVSNNWLLIISLLVLFILSADASGSTMSRIQLHAGCFLNTSSRVHGLRRFES
jgi:hypothetical protein